MGNEKSVGLAACPACGFIPKGALDPSSPEYHRQHRAQHLAKFPRADQRTKDALDELIAMAERREIVSKVGAMRGAS